MPCFGGDELLSCWAVCTSSPLNAYSPCARTRLLSTARGDSSPQAHTACDQGVRTGTVGCTAIGATAPATHRRRLNDTRRSCVGHRREPLLSMADHGRACQATHADHRKGQTCRSKGGNPNPTSSKAIDSRDPAYVPPRARRGSAVPTLTTAHGVHATTRGGYLQSLPTCAARPQEALEPLAITRGAGECEPARFGKPQWLSSQGLSRVISCTSAQSLKVACCRVSCTCVGSALE